MKPIPAQIKRLVLSVTVVVAVLQSAAQDSTQLINDLAFLASPVTAGRETGTPGNLVAQQYIVKRFDSLNLAKAADSWLQPFPLNNNITGNNIIGLVKGTRFPKSYIVISAHYDHLGTRNGSIYFGADDNASGTACLMAMAAYFKKYPPKHSLLFVAFDAEEKGLRGSTYFVQHSPVPLTSVILNLNMDMVSRNDKYEIFASGIYHYPFLKKYIDSIMPTTPVHIHYGHDDPAKGASDDWTNQSDHYNFHTHKIPFVYFGVEDHPDYHKPTDTFDKVDKHFYYRVFLMIRSAALLFDKQEKLQ